jgi:hypothetical protein
MNREIKARREFDRKWKFMKDEKINEFYGKTYLDEKVIEKVGKADEMKNESRGDAFFVSPVMHEALKYCRCGRRLEGSHLIKCLQKCLIKYSETEDEELNHNKDQPPNIPVTSNALTGFYKAKYWHLEMSTNHITPKKFLKHKITDQIYNNIIIG